MDAQKTLKSGVILSKTDSTPIKFAHVININSSIGVTSRENGNYSIYAKKEDTLLISFIGYKTLRVQVSKIFNHIYLEKQIYSLESFIVLPYKNFKEFKEAFVKLELKDTALNKLNTSFVLSVEELRSYIPIGIPLSRSYHNKDKENYKQLLENDKQQALITTRFNPKLIKRITTLEDLMSVKLFMDYCDFTDQFIAISSDYEIITQIFICYDEYNALSVK